MESLSRTDLADPLLPASKQEDDESKPIASRYNIMFLIFTGLLGLLSGSIPFVFGLDIFISLVTSVTDTTVENLSHTQITISSICWSLFASISAFLIYRLFMKATGTCFPRLLSDKGTIHQSELCFAVGDWFGICLGFTSIAVKNGLEQTSMISLLFAVALLSSCVLIWCFKEDSNGDREAKTTSNFDLPVTSFVAGVAVGAALFYAGFQVVLHAFNTLNRTQYIECAVAWSFLSTFLAYMIFGVAIFVAKKCGANGFHQPNMVFRCSYGFAIGDFVGFCIASTSMDILYGLEPAKIALTTGLAAVWLGILVHIGYRNGEYSEEGDSPELPLTVRKTTTDQRSCGNTLEKVCMLTFGIIFGVVAFIFNVSWMMRSVVINSDGSITKTNIILTSMLVSFVTSLVALLVFGVMTFLLQNIIGWKMSSIKRAFLFYAIGEMLGYGTYGAVFGVGKTVSEYPAETALYISIDILLALVMYLLVGRETDDSEEVDE